MEGGGEDLFLPPPVLCSGLHSTGGHPTLVQGLHGTQACYGCKIDIWLLERQHSWTKLVFLQLFVELQRAGCFSICRRMFSQMGQLH